MKEQETDESRKDICARCRWVGFWPQPYGAIEYFCSRRQESIPSGALAKRSCRDFEL